MRPLQLPPVAPEYERMIERAVAQTLTHGEPAGDAVHCAIVVAKGEGRDLERLAAALRRHASRPLHLWVLARPGSGALERRLRGTTSSRLPIRGLARVSRLVLADLLPGVDRVVALAPAAVADADVAVLERLDLGGSSFAAPLKPGASGFGVIHRAAARLRDRTQAASELRRTAHARHRFDFDAFGGDVMVLDLARMRRDGFGSRALPLVQEFDLRDLEVLHYLAGPDRATIPAREAAAFTPREDG